MPIDDVSYLPQAMLATLDVVLECLDGTPLGRPAESGLYHTSPPADCCDAVYVYVESISATKTFPSPYQGPIQCGQLAPVVNVAVKVYRDCWPVVQDSAVAPFPPTADTTVAAANLQMDALALFCCLMSDLSDPDGSIRGGVCVQASIGSIDPGAPQGGCTSWTIRFKLELDVPCCV